MRKCVEKIKDRIKNRMRLVSQPIADNRGIGVVEILLIMVVLIGLVMIFKTQIGDIITAAFDSINKNVDVIIK